MLTSSARLGYIIIMAPIILMAISSVFQLIRSCFSGISGNESIPSRRRASGKGQSDSNQAPAQPKRGRGRPRKNPAPDAAADTSSAATWEDADFTPRCMLANKYADHLAAVAGQTFTLTEKLDGIRCIAHVEPGKAALYTRQGKRITGLDEIERELSALNISAALDGELLIENRDIMPSKEQYKATCCIVRRNGHKTGVVYHVFDILDMAEYNGAPSTPYSARRVRLYSIPQSAHIEIVPVLYTGSDISQIERHLSAQRAANHEGVMINLNDAPYSFTRTNALLKYKIMQDCDLRIIAVNEGVGRNAGHFGSVTVDYKGNPLRVGSGFPADLKRAIWSNPAAYIGRVITVQYFEETEDKTGKKSLRFPIFKELRDIGKEESYA